MNFCLITLSKEKYSLRENLKRTIALAISGLRSLNRTLDAAYLLDFGLDVTVIDQKGHLFISLLRSIVRWSNVDGLQQVQAQAGQKLEPVPLGRRRLLPHYHQSTHIRE